MLSSNVALARAAVVAAALLTPCLASADALDEAVLAEMNYVRANPAAYARELRRAPDWVLEQEEPAAVEEALDFLERQPAMPPLKADPRLASAARQHASSQGARGDVGHGAAVSLGLRLRENGIYAGLSAENISYGFDDARAVVRQLVIDSRVPGRGHRRNIFSSGYSVAGVACGAHRQWGSMCVIDFAGALASR